LSYEICNPIFTLEVFCQVNIKLMKIEITKRNIYWNYLGTFITLGVQILMIPILMFFLNKEFLGLWQVFLSIGNIALLLDFGFSPTIARNFAYVWSGAESLSKIGVTVSLSTETNFYLLKQVLVVCRRIYLFIAVFAFAILTIGGGLYINWVARNLIFRNLNFVWIVFSFSIFFNLYYYYYSAALVGIGAIGDNNKAKVFGSIAQLFTCIVLLLLGAGFFSPVLSYMIYGVVYRALAKKYFYAIVPFEKVDIEKSTQDNKLVQIFSIIWYSAWREGLVSLSQYLVSNATIVVCSLFFALSETGIYSLSLQFITAIALISSVLYSSFQPKIQAAYYKNDIETCARLMSVSLVSYYLFFLFGYILLVTFGIPLLKVINSSYAFNLPLLSGLSVYIFFQKRYSLSTSFISNTNHIPYTRAFIISGLLGLLLSYLFIRFTSYGLWGLLFGQFLAQSLYNNWYWPRLMKKELGLSERKVFKYFIRMLRERWPFRTDTVDD